MRIPLWATFFTLCGVAVLCALGYWQYERLLWKTEILQNIDAALATEASEHLINTEDLNSDKGFVRGYIEGVYDHDKEIRMQSRTYEGKVGYHIITPMALDTTGRSILVNRGWVPIEHEMPKGRAISRPAEKIRAEGVLIYPPTGNLFTLENYPDKDIWYLIDPTQVSVSKELDLASQKVLYAENEGVEQFYPVPVALNLKPNNNHLQYMTFWFLMAGILTVIYFIRFVIPPKKA